jgi:beta-glucosidase
MDPIILGSKYPEGELVAYKEYFSEVKVGDMEIICQPLDFLGVNLYQGTKMAFIK